MPGKNDVEIAIRARDAVGPGVESARQAFSRFARDIESGGRGGGGFGSLTDGAIKFGAAVNGIRGAVQAATSVVHLFKGDTSAALDVLSRLPLGIGAVVSEFREFEKALTSTAEAEKKILASVRLNISEQKALQELNSVGNTGFLAVLDRERETRERLEKEADAEAAKLLEVHNGRKTQAYIDDVKRVYDILAIQIEASKKRVQIESDANTEKNRKIIEADVKAAREAAEKAAAEEEKARQNAIKSRIARASTDETNPLIEAAIEGAIAADSAAIIAARNALRGRQDFGALPAGDQSLYTTGVAASATQRMQSEASKQTSLMEKQLKKLEDLENVLKNNEQAKPAAQLNLTVGAFGDIG